MVGDPTPMEYDEPFVHVEWGVALESGESARMLDEYTARLTAHHNPRALLVKRTVIYQPWTVVRKDPDPPDPSTAPWVK